MCLLIAPSSHFEKPCADTMHMAHNRRKILANIMSRSFLINEPSLFRARCTLTTSLRYLRNHWPSRLPIRFLSFWMPLASASRLTPTKQRTSPPLSTSLAVHWTYLVLLGLLAWSRSRINRVELNTSLSCWMVGQRPW